MSHLWASIGRRRLLVLWSAVIRSPTLIWEYRTDKSETMYTGCRSHRGLNLSYAHLSISNEQFSIIAKTVIVTDCPPYQLTSPSPYSAASPQPGTCYPLTYDRYSHWTLSSESWKHFFSHRRILISHIQHPCAGILHKLSISSLSSSPAQRRKGRYCSDFFYVGGRQLK